MARSIVTTLSLLLLLAAPLAAASNELGQIDFPSSGAPAAQDAFIRGVLLLHSFEYPDAREAFQEAQKIDPAFALAYWGEAMTHNHTLWRQQDREAALAALARFAPTAEERLAKTPTERERGFMRAIELLYGEGDKVARDVAYSEAMADLSARHPDDLEARSFYALSILGTTQGTRDFSVYMRAGAVTEEIFDANPLHPGAVHYMIHSYDDPVHAPLGLRAARVYAKIAPAASHAQHMISHIYVALGRWADSVDANVRAVDVSIERRKRKELGPDAVSYHALHWLAYSYHQLGRFDEARAKLDMMTAFANESGSATALWHHAAMRAAWIVETNGREAPAEIRTDETQVSGAAAALFATGYSSLLAGDREAAAMAADHLAVRHEAAASGHHRGMSGGMADTSDLDLEAAEVMRKSLLALIGLDRGNAEQALALMDEATAAEDAMPLEYGPPTIVKPSHELYGEVLMRLGRPDEARAQFEKALQRAPRRSLSLAGLATAAKAMGDDAARDGACAELRTNYSRADESVRLPEACGAGSDAARAKTADVSGR